MAENRAKERGLQEEGAAELKEELLKLAQGGRVSCAQATALAERLGVEARRVGAAANELGLKITACRLGCF